MVQVDAPPFYVRFRLRNEAKRILSDRWMTIAEMMDVDSTKEDAINTANLMQILVDLGYAERALAIVGDDKEWVYRCRG